jgi:hypothetical protein
MADVALSRKVVLRPLVAVAADILRSRLTLDVTTLTGSRQVSASQLDGV